MGAAMPEVKFGDWISEGWRLFADQWKAWVLHALVFFAISMIPVALLIILLLAAEMSPLVPLAMVLLIAAIILAQAWLMGGMYRSAFEQLRGGRIELADIFSAGDCALRIMAAMLLIGLLYLVGALMCLIPGFLVLGLFFFTVPLIVERGVGVLEAMRASFELARSNLLMFTLFALLVSLLASAGSYVCYVGALVTYPLFFTVAAVAYRDCFGLEGALGFWGRCPSCGLAPLPGGAAFCPSCGSQLV